MAYGYLKEQFEARGVVVIPRPFKTPTVIGWVDAWKEWRKTAPRNVNEFKPQEILETAPEPLRAIAYTPELLDLIEALYGPDIALYNFRFVVKDRNSTRPVFLHQDSGYHVGRMRKLSAFVALSRVRHFNGAMGFITGSHKYGYLGDAGEIHAMWQGRLESAGHTLLVPDMEPGDVVLMDSATWHFSFPHDPAREDRVLADVIYQPADDPSGEVLLRGQWRCTPARWLRSGQLFNRSRVTRLRELETEKRFPSPETIRDGVLSAKEWWTTIVNPSPPSDHLMEKLVHSILVRKESGHADSAP